MKNFWAHLAKPIFVLAPMEDVTDAAFREIIATHSKGFGAQYVTFTEFTSADGLARADEKGQKKLRSKLRFSEQQRPIVAQLFSATPEYMEQAARIASELGFDGVDINMGCPDRSVEKQGAGAALIKNRQNARRIVDSAQKGANGLPVSVKTRIGYSTDELEEWLDTLLSMDLAALTIHARTRNEMSKVPARWDAIEKAVRIRDAMKSETLIIGNGDVQSVTDAKEKAAQAGCDGVMIGRAMFGNPWIMSEHAPAIEEKLRALVAHTELFEKEFTGIKSFAVMRKHFASYVEGFEGAKELRIKLMECNTASEVKKLLSNYSV